MIIALFSYYIARDQNERPRRVVLEHPVIAILAVTITHYTGDWVAKLV